MRAGNGYAISSPHLRPSSLPRRRLLRRKRRLPNASALRREPSAPAPSPLRFGRTVAHAGP